MWSGLSRRRCIIFTEPAHSEVTRILPVLARLTTFCNWEPLAYSSLFSPNKSFRAVVSWNHCTYWMTTMPQSLLVSRVQLHKVFRTFDTQKLYTTIIRPNSLMAETKTITFFSNCIFFRHLNISCVRGLVVLNRWLRVFFKLKKKTPPYFIKGSSFSEHELSNK